MPALEKNRLKESTLVSILRKNRKKPKVTRKKKKRGGDLKNRVATNKIEIMKKVNLKNKACNLRKLVKFINLSFLRLIRKRERTKIANDRNEKAIITDSTDMRGIRRKYENFVNLTIYRIW